MDFFDNVSKNASTIEEISGKITKAIAPVANTLNIGKMEIALLYNPATAFTPQVTNDVIMLYHYDGGYADTPVNNTFTTGLNGKAEVSVYPRKGVNWNEEDIRYINSLSSVIYTLCAKAQITNMLNIATTTDAMTSIPNSIGVYQFIGSLCARGIEAAYTAVFYNIKNFRCVNQRFGAKNGDVALKKYAARIRDFIDSDELVGRMGGDNFVSVVKNEHIDDFLNFISSVKVILNINSKIISTEISARAGIYPIEAGDSMSTVMNNISIALSVSRKSLHRDFIWYRPTMMEQTMRDKELSGAFSGALAAKEFEVYYQPKVDLKTNKLCGCEALARWRRDDRVLQPAQFIPILENEGSICALDFYILNRVCEDIRGWLDEGITPVRISTNFSRLHMNNPKLADDILNVVKRYDIDPSYIEVELTETIGYEDFDALSSFVKKLHDFGFHTSIDDFGTGYSSLNLLSELPVDVIKLDKSFVTPQERGDNENEEGFKQRVKSNLIVVKTIISMALELGLNVICEGVETKEQAKLLKELGCHMAQGFLYDRPLPHDEFTTRLDGYEYDVF
jgi:diguanylate cyclase (GGDEF)-like protein